MKLPYQQAREDRDLKVAFRIIEAIVISIAVILIAASWLAIKLFAH